MGEKAAGKKAPRNESFGIISTKKKPTERRGVGEEGNWERSNPQMPTRARALGRVYHIGNVGPEGMTVD